MTLPLHHTDCRTCRFTNLTMQITNASLKSHKAQDVLLVQIESNFNFKRHVIKLARSPCYIVQSCQQDLNTFLSFYRAKQDNGCEFNEASNLHAANVLKARSFVLACQCTVCVRSPSSLKSRGGSQMPGSQQFLQNFHQKFSLKLLKSIKCFFKKCQSIPKINLVF